MRYLFLLLLTFSIACGDDSAKPKRQKDDQDMILDSSVEEDMILEDVGGLEEIDLGTPCSPLECRSDELINMIQVKREFEYASLGGIEFEPKPFEFRYDMGE